MIYSTATPPQSGRVFIYIVIMIAAITGGIVVSSQLLDRTRDLRHAQPFPEARQLARFELERASGEAFTRTNLEGRWSLVFFGFTNCPDVCPDTLAKLAKSMNELTAMGREALPQVVFVSVDPQRDRGEALSEYVGWFHDEFIGVTGSEEQLEDFTRQLGSVYFREDPDEDTGFYNVDHSASVLIIDPEGRLYGRFAAPMSSEDITADLFTLTR